MITFLKKRINKIQKNRGFTLLETLVAIFILVLSITGPMVFSQSGLRASFQARDQITAFFLAQDAIETIKNIRDDNGIDGEDWLSGLVGSGLCDGNTPCMIDTTEEIPSVSACSSGSCPSLNIVSDTQKTIYTYTGGDTSRFVRTIYMDQIKDDEVAIVVEVEWDNVTQGSRNRIVVQENIFNWIPANVN